MGKRIAIANSFFLILTRRFFYRLERERNITVREKHGPHLGMEPTTW